MTVATVDAGEEALLEAAAVSEETRDPAGLFRLAAGPFVGRPPPILAETMLWQARASLDMIRRACAEEPVRDEAMVCYALDGADHLLELARGLLAHEVLDAFAEEDRRAVPAARLLELVDGARSAAAGVRAIGHGSDLDDLTRCADPVAGLLATADGLLNEAIELLDEVRSDAGLDAAA